MKAITVLLSGLLLFGYGLTQLKAQTMYVKEKIGPSTPFPIGKIRKLTFSPGNIKVSNWDQISYTYQLKDVRYLIFSDWNANVLQVLTKDLTVPLLADGTATIPQDAVNDCTTDACQTYSYATDITQFTCADVGHPVTVTLKVTDIIGNQASKTAKVTLEDRISPVVQTKPLSIYLKEDGTATIAQDAVDDGSTDNCGIESFQTDITQFSEADINHPVTVKLTVTDIHGNQAQGEAIVNVKEFKIIDEPIKILLMYPNPAYNKLTVKLPETEDQDGWIEITTIEGKVISRTTIEKGIFLYNINVSDLANSAYLCRITYGIMVTLKFIKQ